MDDSAKLDRLLEGDVEWIKQHREETRLLGTRLGNIEVAVGKHDVRLTSLERKKQRPPGAGRWFSVIEFLGAVPTYGHLILVTAVTLLGVFGVHVSLAPASPLRRLFEH